MIFPHVCHDSFLRGQKVFVVRSASGNDSSCNMTHSYVWCDSFICVMWLIHMCDVAHSNVWQDSIVYVTWLIAVWTQCLCRPLGLLKWQSVWHDLFVCMTWLICISDMIHSHVWHKLIAVRAQRLGRILNLLKGQPQWHESFPCVAWRIYRCDMTYHVYNMTRWSVGAMFWLSVRPTWLIHMCDVTHSYVWHDPFLFLTCLVPAWLRRHFILVVQETSWNGSPCAMTLSYAWHDDSFIGHSPAEK